MVQTLEGIRDEVRQGVNRVISSGGLPDFNFYLFSDNVYNSEYHATWVTQDMKRILFIKVEDVNNPEGAIITTLINNF